MKRTLVCLLLSLLCAAAALAEPALEARIEDGRLAVRWTGCACPEATLTIYRDGWASTGHARGREGRRIRRALLLHAGSGRLRGATALL